MTNNRIKLLLTGGALAMGASSFAQGQQERPNILFIIADDASMWTFNAYGGDFVKTPAIDMLAKEGAVFSNAYTQNPKSSPSRATILTGKHTWQLKQAANHFFHFPEEFAVYPTLLQESGYNVGYTGKGWGPGTFSSEHNPAGKHYNKIRIEVPYKGINSSNYSANFEDFLTKNENGNPFCFWMGCFEPHRAYELDSWKKEGLDLNSVTPQPFLPDNDLVRGDLLDYAVEVEWFDKHIGEAVEILKKRGQLENTIVIVTSDHGMPFPRVKGQIYEESFHIPFIMYWNGKIKSGTVIDDFVGFQDIAPTFMQIAGLEVHEQMSGRSFLDVIDAQRSGHIDQQRDHMILFKERHDVGRMDKDGVNLAYPVRGIRTKDFLYVKNYKSNRWPAGNPEFGYTNCDAAPTKSYLIDLLPHHEDYRLYEMAFGKRTEEELFDIKRDPHCMNNLAYTKRYAKVKEELLTRMESELKQSGDPRMFGEGEIFEKYEYVGKRFDYSAPYK